VTPLLTLAREGRLNSSGGYNYTGGQKDTGGFTCTAPTSALDVPGAIVYAVCQMQTGANMAISNFNKWAAARVIRTVFMLLGITFVVIGVRTMLRPESEESAINITGAAPAPRSEPSSQEPSIVKKATHAAIQGAAGAAGGVVGETAARKFINRPPKTSGSPKP
jgi:hypothetical protein